jgi:DNA-binding transcriptional LysR family regulator
MIHLNATRLQFWTNRLNRGTMIDLFALSDFNAVARHGGFGAAARATGRPKATLSRRVAELEASLGTRLLERGARQAKLTQEGQALFQKTSGLLTEIDEAAHAVASGSDVPRGRLKISAPLLFAQGAMGKLAAGFALKHPGVRIEVTAEDRAVDMIEEGYDLVIRVNPRPDETLIGRAFLHDELVAVAEPRFVRPTDGSPLPAVVLGSSSATEWQLEIDKQVEAMPIEPIMHLSSLLMVRDAVRAGVGVGLLPLSLSSRDLADGRLRLLGRSKTTPAVLWALYPSRRLLSTRVAVFLDHLAETFPQGTAEELAHLFEA